jgi:hypothetical protein
LKGAFHFMADDLSLLFRLRADNTQAKAAMADTRAAVNQLRQSFGPQLTQSVTVANKTFSDLGNNLNNFVAQRVPAVGGAVVRVTDALKGLGDQGPKNQKALSGIAQSIQSISTQSGKTIPQVSAFLSKFVQLEGQTAKNDAAFKFFGGSVDLIGNKTAKFIPELEKASGEMAILAGASTRTGASVAAMAGPIGIAVAALVAMAAGAVLAARELFDLTKRAAEFQGRMHDLAQQTGLSVATLSALEIQAKKTGGELGSITQAIVLFQRNLDDAQDPLSKTAEQFRKLGVNTSDTETSLRSAFEALAKMPEGFAQTNAAAELFGGRGGKQVLAILKETNGDLDGTIKRLREAGILISEDAARAADIFNDELALLEFQMRALTAAAANDLIPVMVEAIKAFGNLAAAVRPVTSVLGALTAAGLRPVVKTLKDVSVAVQILTGDYGALARAIKEAEDAQNITPLKVPDVRVAPLPGAPSARQAAGDAANQSEAVVAIVKRNAAATNQALDEMFQRGRISRQRQAEDTIAGNKRILEAERERIDAQLALKEQEIKALDEAQRNRGEIASRDSDQYRAITAQITKLQQERLDKESEFEVTSRAIRARAAQENAEARRSQIQNEGDILVKETERTIARVEAEIKRGERSEEEGFAIIDQLEQERASSRIQTLEQQKAVGFLTIQEQKDLNKQLTRLQQERDQLEDDQRARRLQREIEAAARNREILTANLDAIIQQEQIVGERRISTLKALADQRVITEEQAAQKILQIRLDLIDDEIAATETKLSAAKAITDKDERIRVQTELNNQIKILTEQRKTIQAEGDRDVEAGRQKDLENERRYADQLKEIKERIRDIERDAAEEVIRLMVIHFASRKDIIRARLQQDIADENSRHSQALETIQNLEQENRESKKTAEEKLAAEKELNLLREAEAERHRLAMQGIKAQGKKDEEEADPLGRLSLDTESLEQFAATLEDTIVPLGEILRNTFLQVADAIGQTVQNWVLLGETGPAVMRKILAQALASIAAEAAVNAIKELALGFATLFFAPEESAAHFTAAALWASIGGVAAIAGRGVAGDLFKPKSAGAGGGSGSSSRDRDLNPLTLARNAGPGAQQQIAPQIQPIRVQINVNDSKFGKAITAHVVEDINNAGPIREVIAGDGNLNRG